MKRKLVTKLLCLVLASTVVATMAPVNFYTVSAETQDQSEDVAVQAEPRVVLQDGINDQWTQEASSVVGSDECVLWRMDGFILSQVQEMEIIREQNRPYL